MAWAESIVVDGLTYAALLLLLRARGGGQGGGGTTAVEEGLRLLLLVGQHRLPEHQPPSAQRQAAADLCVYMCI